MIKRTLFIISLFVSGFFCSKSYAQQQDVDFHLSAHLLQGQKILKVKRDFNDIYLWALAQNNKVYRINSETLVVDDYTAKFAAYNNFQFIDIAGRSQDTVFVATSSPNVIEYKNGTLRDIGSADGIPGNVNSVGMSPGLQYSQTNNAFILMIASAQGFRWYDINAEKVIPPNDSEGNSSTGNSKIYEATYRTEFYKDSSMLSTCTNSADTIQYQPVIYKEIGTIVVGWLWEGGNEFGGNSYYDNPGLIKQNLLVGTDKGLYFSSSIYTGAQDSLRKFSLFHDDELGTGPINDICVNEVPKSYPVCENGAWVGTNDGLYLLKPDYAAYLGNQQLDAVNFKDQPNTITTLQLCANSSATAEVNTTIFTGNVQWYKDGAELPEESNDSLMIKTAGDYYAVLYDPCANISLQSNHLKVDTISAPVFTFNYPAVLNECAGSTTVLTVQGSTQYQYRWYQDGVLNGVRDDSISVNQSGNYKAEVSVCTDTWVPTDSVQINFLQLQIPIINTGKPSYCLGDQATLNLNTPVDTGYTISWLRDGDEVMAYRGLTSVVTSIPGSYVVVLTSNSIKDCTQTAKPVQILFNPPPVISVQQTVDNTLCQGQTVTLKVNDNGGAVHWSTGETGVQIKVNTSGTYKVTLTSAAGCSSDTSSNIQFLPNPVLAINDTTLCEYSRQSVTLTAPPGYSSYLWNNQPGDNTFKVSSPQTVALTVTDINGCQAVQQIIIADKCADILIPNTFTPNGDGINDTWDISGISGDNSVSVKIFNRYGTLLYQQKGDYTPWNGEYAGKKLSPGVYYYILTAKNGQQKFSGSLTIIY